MTWLESTSECLADCATSPRSTLSHPRRILPASVVTLPRRLQSCPLNRRFVLHSPSSPLFGRITTLSRSTAHSVQYSRRLAASCCAINSFCETTIERRPGGQHWETNAVARRSGQPGINISCSSQRRLWEEGPRPVQTGGEADRQRQTSGGGGCFRHAGACSLQHSTARARSDYHSRPPTICCRRRRRENRRRRRVAEANDGNIIAAVGRPRPPRVTANYYNQPCRDFREHAPGLRLHRAASKTIFLRSELGGRAGGGRLAPPRPPRSRRLRRRHQQPTRPARRWAPPTLLGCCTATLELTESVYPRQQIDDRRRTGLHPHISLFQPDTCRLSHVAAVFGLTDDRSRPSCVNLAADLAGINSERSRHKAQILFIVSH